MAIEHPTLATMAKMLDPNGKIDKIAEMLSESNPILQDMVVKEGNLPTGHKGTIRTGLPDVAWRLLNYGVQSSASTTQQVVDTCGMLESYAEVDASLAALNNNTAQFRLSEDRAFLEAMNQEMARTLFYGDTTINPERFLGLSARYSTVNPATAPIGQNVVDAGGVGANNRSVWFIGWGQETIHGIYPNGSKVGWQHKDLGEVTLHDANNGKYQGYRTHYKWDLGLHVKDYRYGVRIANIDADNITAPDLINYMIAASEIAQDLKMGRWVIYMPKSLRTLLRQLIVNKSNVYLNFDNVEGHRVMMFDDFPVRAVDALNTAEARVI